MVNPSSRMRPHNGWWQAPGAPRRLPDPPAVVRRPAR